MFQQKFVDRKEELAFLGSAFKEKSPQFVIIYGRRRVGKTELIKEFIKDKPHVYFLAEESKEKSNIRELQRLMASFLQDSLFGKADISHWHELFSEFKGKIGNKRIIIVIDEFPYLIKGNNAVVSVFQKVWDECLSKTNAFLILCGSSISMMETELLAKKSPVYGRRTGQWRLEPVRFRHLKKFFPAQTIKGIIEIYAIIDAIPLYLLKFEKGMDAKSNIILKVFQKGRFLYQEAEFLLKEEMREPGNYFELLKAVSFGNSKFGDIVNSTGFEKTMVSKYLDNLIKLHIIRKEFPVTSRKEKARDSLYRFEDNYFHFWFRFVYPHRSMIEEGKGEALMGMLSEEFNRHVSFVFEDVASHFLLQKWNIFNISKIGRWWHKEKEIDIVAINDESKDILFAECKWQDKVDAEKLLLELKEKAGFVEWNKGKRKEHYALFAMSFKKKAKGAICFDLKDMAGMFRK